jgi:hypothetical protein
LTKFALRDREIRAETAAILRREIGLGLDQAGAGKFSPRSIDEIAAELRAAPGGRRNLECTVPSFVPVNRRSRESGNPGTEPRLWIPALRCPSAGMTAMRNLR